ncbi:aminodeoxychorismate synthase component I [Allosphingosinicella indica]|uniref:Probable branched-chain-amino-acid aminotransferase n=1 Tax=Allosphingosinicella indica TaxID=941907 RepID=A0A1X7GGP3_9SPHN|nr:aminodeoxychorismate synthase component I [Allosphingosinicella indica]SMF69545.1 para-aminobenzoate synthetase / 4-amino-4-deoxychorismate lyase [Allosphingosinicella indica]
MAFVLIDDARPGGRATLYRDPAEIVVAHRPDEVRPALERLRDLGGRHAAGFLSYEAGYALEPKLAPLAGEGEQPLLWFGLFDRAEPVDADAFLPDPAAGWAGAIEPLVARDDYEARAAQVIEHIFAGDIYQANLSFPASVRTAGDLRAVYAAIRRRAGGGHGALVHTGDHWLLSFSPELFFTLADGHVVTRPMKGTAVRAPGVAADRAAAAALHADPKQRAENLMIVDLLRNDLSRVARPHSVQVPALYAIETYPTVHQMTSTVTADLAAGVGPVDLIEAIFPCGSITGAPKIRAMEIIAGLEARTRGVYTGAIGTIGPGGDAAFNVAIRTLAMKAGETMATIGLGSGIVADSRVEDEWRECLAKGAFVGEAAKFDLFETMRFDPVAGIVALDRHLQRMKDSAGTLGFAFDRHDARNELQAATFRLREARKVRLRLSPSGAIAVEVRPLPEAPFQPVPVAIAPLPVDAADFRLRHKTSNRAFYDDARAASGAFEAVFEDGEGFLTEGSFTHLFVERGGVLLTPPLVRGMLPGTLRAELIETGKAEEAELTRADLSGGFLIGNMLRGLLRAKLARPSARR